MPPSEGVGADQAELLAQLARDVPDLTPEEFRRRLIEVCRGDEVAAVRLAEAMERQISQPLWPRE